MKILKSDLSGCLIILQRMRYKVRDKIVRTLNLPREIELFGFTTDYVIVEVKPKEIVIRPYEEKENKEENTGGGLHDQQ